MIKECDKDKIDNLKLFAIDRIGYIETKIILLEKEKAVFEQFLENIKGSDEQ